MQGKYLNWIIIIRTTLLLYSIHVFFFALLCCISSVAGLWSVIFLDIGSANEGRRYSVTSILNGGVYTQNDRWVYRLCPLVFNTFVSISIWLIQILRYVRCPIVIQRWTTSYWFACGLQKSNMSSDLAKTYVFRYMVFDTGVVQA